MVNVDGANGGLNAVLVSLLTLGKLFPQFDVYCTLMLSPVCAAALFVNRMRTIRLFRLPESIVAETDKFPTSVQTYPVEAVFNEVAPGNAGAA